MVPPNLNQTVQGGYESVVEKNAVAIWIISYLFLLALGRAMSFSKDSSVANMKASTRFT